MIKLNAEQRRALILNEHPLKILLYLAVPTFLMQAVGASIPLIDGIFLNQNASSTIASGVSLSGPLINIVSALGTGLAVASMAIIGQLYGRGEMLKIRKIGSQLLGVALLMGLLIIPAMPLGAYLLTLRTSSDLSRVIWSYLIYFTPVLPFIFISNIYNAFKEATGQPGATFTRMIILLILKVFFNAIYLSFLHWEEQGAALASLSSYILITLWMVYDLYVKPSQLRFRFSSTFKLEGKTLFPILKIAIPSMLNPMLISMGFLFIALEMVDYGTNVINAQGIASNINAICFTLPAAISSTITTIVSINISVKQVKKAKSVFFYGLLLSLFISLSILVFMHFFDRNLVLLFRNEPEIVDITLAALVYYNLSILPFGFFSVAQGVFIGLGQTKITLFAGFVRVWLFRYLFILVTKSYFGYFSVFYGNLFSNIVAAIGLFIWLYLTPWKSIIDNELEQM